MLLHIQKYKFQNTHNPVITFCGANKAHIGIIGARNCIVFLLYYPNSQGKERDAWLLKTLIIKTKIFNN